MQLSNEHIEKYQKLYEEIHGSPIDFKSAQNELRALVCMLKTISDYYKHNEHTMLVFKKTHDKS